MSVQGPVDETGRSPADPPRAVKKQAPQKTVDDFWAAFTTKFPGKVHTIIPKNAYSKSKAAHEPKGTVCGQPALKSYEEARDECVATVEKIAKECERVNMRYRDPHFDIEFDLKNGKRDCLNGLLIYPDAGTPKSVKRVHVRAPRPHGSCCAAPAWAPLVAQELTTLTPGLTANLRRPAILRRRRDRQRRAPGPRRRLLVPGRAGRARQQAGADRPRVREAQ